MADERASARAASAAGGEAKSDGYAPSRNTIFLLEDREGLPAPALRYLMQTYPRAKYPDGVVPARIQQKIDTSRLFQQHEIVVVFLDPGKPYEDQPPYVQGQPRAALRPIFKMSAPIKVADLYQESADGGGSVQVRNLINENTGRVQPGLCELISRGCMVEDEFSQLVPSVRAIYRDDDRTLRVSNG